MHALTVSHDVGYTSVCSQAFRPIQHAHFPVQLSIATSPGLPYGVSNGAKPFVDDRLSVPATPDAADAPKSICISSYYSIGNPSGCRRFYSTFCFPFPHSMVRSPVIPAPILSAGS